MKRVISSLCLLAFSVLFPTVLLNAQSAVFAGFNKSVALGSKVQLNAVSVYEGVWDSVPGMADYGMLDICYANDTIAHVKK